MGKSKIKRVLFFWVDKLQIDRRERISIAFTLVVLVLLFVADIFINPKEVPAPENHKLILKEFERRSAIAKRKKEELEQRYNPKQRQVVDKPEVKATENTEKISINTGTLEELTELPGIGETYASRIIKFRETNGEFNSVEELKQIKGIGDKTLEKLRPLIKL